MLLITSWPMARSLTEAMKSLTTGKATSASSSATRTSRRASETSASDNAPRRFKRSNTSPSRELKPSNIKPSIEQRPSENGPVRESSRTDRPPWRQQSLRSPEKAGFVIRLSNGSQDKGARQEYIFPTSTASDGGDADMGKIEPGI